MATAFKQTTLAVLAAGALSTALPAAAQVRYLSGGVGQMEQEKMQQAARDYSLGLTFATQQGAYLAGVDVSILDQRGQQVLSAKSDGPIMLVNLPTGSYTVEANFEGQLRRHAVQVSGQGHQQMILNWPPQTAMPAAAGQPGN